MSPLLSGRQFGPGPSISSSLPTSSGSSGSLGSVSWSILLPIVAVIGALALIIGIYSNRRRISQLLQRQNGDVPLTPTSTQTLSAAELLAVNRPNGPGESPGDGNTIGGIRQIGQIGAIRGQRRRRGIRRTDSGVSIRTLPAYSKEAGDEELVLVRRSSMDSLAEDDESDLSDRYSIRGGEQTPMVQTTPLPAAVTVERGHTVRHSPSQSSVTLPGRTSPAILPSPAQPEDPCDRPSSALSDGMRRSDSISRRQSGDAPTYLEAMSSSHVAGDVEAGVPPPRTPASQTLRERTSSTFRNILSRTGLTSDNNKNRLSSQSSASLLLHPQSSRLSTMSSASTRPGSALQISSPLSHTAVRASFDLTTLPRAGLSDDQMRYLASNEALHQAGVNLSTPPSGRRRGRSDATLRSDASPSHSRCGSSASEVSPQPPTWEELHSTSASPMQETSQASSPLQMPSNSGGTDLQITRSDQATAGDPAPESPALPSRPSTSLSFVSALPPTLSIEPPTPSTASPGSGYFPHRRPETSIVPNRS